MINRIKSWFFFPVNPEVFGLARILFYFLLFWFYNQTGILNPDFWGGMEKSTFWEPISFFSIMSAEEWLTLSPHLILLIWKVSMIFCMLGFVFRFSSLIAALSFLFLAGFLCNFGKVHHSNHMPAVFLLLLAFSGGAGEFSLDAAISRFQGRDCKAETSHGWFYRAAFIYVGLVYLNAGMSKWTTTGFEWASNTNMATIILSRPTVTAFGKWIANSNWIPGFLAISTLILQPSCILIPFSKWARVILLPSMFFMHLGTYLVLGAHGAFLPYNISLILLIPMLLPEKIIKPTG